MKKSLPIFFFMIVLGNLSFAQSRARELGIEIGVMKPGPFNAITDVEGVRVGHTTLVKGENVRTGITAVIPHSGNIFQEKVPAALHTGNGFGKLMGISQIKELGNIETPILLTNTLNVPKVADALVSYLLQMEGNENVRSINPVVGETNDGRLNDIRGRHLGAEHVRAALENASAGAVEEGNVGAGTGTVCFGFKGGIGTASRKLPESLGGYTVGVLVQSNFGGVLQIDGVPIGQELNQYYLNSRLNDDADGSIMIIVATDAPLNARNLQRVAKRAIMGLAKAGGIASNGSGDYVIAFSTHPDLRIPYRVESPVQNRPDLHNDYMSPIFMATIEATEEAIINSLFAAKTMSSNGRTIKALPVDQVLPLMKKYGRLNKK